MSPTLSTSKQRRMGRPPLPAAERRQCHLACHVDPELRDRAFARARHEGVSVSGLLSQALTRLLATAESADRPCAP